MNLKYTKSYDNCLKRLKRYPEHLKTLDKILNIITNSEDFTTLKQNPLVSMYHFEQLKYQLNEYYSFRLEKKGGVIRLIVKPVSNTLLELSYICTMHYKDFDKKKVIYYDE